MLQGLSVHKNINSQSCLDIGQNQHDLADIALEEAVMSNRALESEVEQEIRIHRSYSCNGSVN